MAGRVWLCDRSVAAPSKFNVARLHAWSAPDDDADADDDARERECEADDDDEDDEDDEDDDDDDYSNGNSDEEAVLCVFPFELNESEVRKVFLELGFETLIHLVSRLEDADAILGVKTRVKSAKWLRHAARSRGIPIYAMKTERPVSLIKAARAMLGESDISASEDDAH